MPGNRSLKAKALASLGSGDLEGANRLLRPMGEHHTPDGNAMATICGEFWNRNRLQEEAGPPA